MKDTFCVLSVWPGFPGIREGALSWFFYGKKQKIGDREEGVEIRSEKRGKSIFLFQYGYVIATQ
jgi:hypothetical protein